MAQVDFSGVVLWPRNKRSFIFDHSFFIHIPVRLLGCVAKTSGHLDASIPESDTCSASEELKQKILKPNFSCRR
jgi:hypothetical protein